MHKPTMDDISDVLALLLRIAVGAAVIIAAYFLLLGRRADFVIEVRRGKVRSKGSIPLAVVQRLTPFLLGDLAIKDSVRILGARRGQRVRVWFRGRVSPADQQRIRNFIMSGA